MKPYESRVAIGAHNAATFGHHDIDNIEVSYGASRRVETTYQDFLSEGTPFAVSGNDEVPHVVDDLDGSFLRLVNATHNQLGTVAFERTAEGTYTQIRAGFRFRITPGGPGSRADGFAFALLSTDRFGLTGTPTFEGGEPLYLGEEPAIASVLAVGFDVYRNEHDPSDNHVSVHYDRQLIGSFEIDPGEFDLADGGFHHASISVAFEAGGGRVSVTLDGEVHAVPSLLVPGLTPYESRVAFGARTGGAFAAHDIADVNVRTTDTSSWASTGRTAERAIRGRRSGSSGIPARPTRHSSAVC